MRLDPLLATTSAEIPEAARDEVRASLDVAAANFVNAGGVVSLTEWASLSSESREAIVVAQMRRREETAALFARAILPAQANPAAALGGGA